VPISGGNVALNLVEESIFKPKRVLGEPFLKKAHPERKNLESALKVPEFPV